MGKCTRKLGILNSVVIKHFSNFMLHILPNVFIRDDKEAAGLQGRFLYFTVFCELI